MTLQETQTPRGSRYYVDGRRISRAAMRAVKDDAERAFALSVVVAVVVSH